MGMEKGAAAVENSMAVPQKINTELPYDPVTSHLGIYPKESKAGIQIERIFLHPHS